MDPIDICPPWWPHLLWHLHHPPPIVFPHDPPPNPVNYPPEINRILLALVTYSSTYQIGDEAAAMELRAIAQKEVLTAARNLGVESR